MVDLSDTRLSIVDTSSLQSFCVEPIDLIVALSSESEVYWRSDLIILLVNPEVKVHAIGSIANQCVGYKDFALVAERRKSGIVEFEDVVKRCSGREEAEVVEHVDGGVNQLILFEIQGQQQCHDRLVGGIYLCLILQNILISTTLLVVVISRLSIIRRSTFLGVRGRKSAACRTKPSSEHQAPGTTWRSTSIDFTRFSDSARHLIVKKQMEVYTRNPRKTAAAVPRRLHEAKFVGRAELSP